MSELKIWVEDCVPVDLTLKSVSGGNLGIGGLRTPLILIDSSMESSIVSWFLSTEADNCMFDEKLVTGINIKIRIAGTVSQDCSFFLGIFCINRFTSRFLDR
jgi:hypothetical protein